MSKIDEILAIAMVTARLEEWNDKRTLAKAKAELLQLVLEVIGEDETIDSTVVTVRDENGYEVELYRSSDELEHDKWARKDLREEQRKRAKELFGVDND